ncbi:MAG: CoA synthetase [Nitrospinota bacterium]|nr:MAG: CoA synthetase [Nitrospinota bacterium]
MRYTPAEFMATVIAREIGDGEMVAVGTLSPLPAMGAFLARETHAPRATIIILGSDDWFPLTGGSKEFHDLGQRGRFDLFFLSGAQIDQHGNINLTVIGTHQQPRVRLPGGAGSAVLYFMARRIILFRPEHTRRTFVPRVDFITSPGSSPPRIFRPGGPSKVITPLATLRFNQEKRRLELATLHPGVTLEEVEANTGFPLYPPSPVPTTPPPTPEELHVLRTRVRAEMERVYPAFARTAFLSATG